jgi:pimeloyl-ACP methyl ester carboxylesterase
MSRPMAGEYPDRAIVVIHGIGEQRRGATLEAMVRGLKRCGATGGDPVKEDRPFGEDLPTEALRINRNGVVADIYEVHWAPHTARKTTARSVLSWLFKASLIPASKLRAPSRKTWWDIAAALVALAFIAVVVLYGLTSLANLSAQVDCRARGAQAEDSQVVCELPPEQRRLAGPGVTWENLAQVSAIWGAVAESVTLTERPLADFSPAHAGEVLQRIPITYWLLMIVVFYLSTQVLFRIAQVIATLVQGRALHRRNRLGPQLVVLGALVVGWYLIVQMLAPVAVAFVLVFVIVGSVAAGARRFLAESLGDVQVYSERDENSEHFAAREEVLAEAEKAFAVIARRGYKHIVVVGHSLGAVIAFTSLDRLGRRLPPLLERIEAFVTLGSALEKVRYFFERAKPRDRAAEQRLEAPAHEIAEGRVWLNLWYANDVVANPVTTFQKEGDIPKGYRSKDLPELPQLVAEAKRNLVVNINYGYPITRLPVVWTHSRYWGDMSVLRLITEIALPTRSVSAPTNEPGESVTPGRAPGRG